MPVMNGYDLTRAIRQHEQTLQRPPCTILGFTANAQPEERLRCKKSGMNDCLFKPISLTLLSQRLNAIDPPYQKSEIINIESLYALSGRDESRIKRLLEELLRSNRDDLQSLLELPLTEDPEPFNNLAHRIKGAARIVGAHDLIKQCEALEQASPATLPACRTAMQRAMESLEQAMVNELSKGG